MLRMADDMIKESMANGEFDNLAGLFELRPRSCDSCTPRVCYSGMRSLESYIYPHTEGWRYEALFVADGMSNEIRMILKNRIQIT